MEQIHMRHVLLAARKELDRNSGELITADEGGKETNVYN